MLKALLVDDEMNNLNSLEFLIHHDCEGLEVTGKAQSAAEARVWLGSHLADVVFLDIAMPGENGFQFLNSLATRNFKVVFITAYNEYALQAIKASAVDYILKPISIDELQNAVSKVKLALANPVADEQNRLLLQHLLQTITKNAPPKKIALPQLGSISFIEVDDIVSLQADSNYTIIHMKDMHKLVISKTLKDFEGLLDENQFARIHKSYIVNLKYIKEYSTIDGGIVKMSDGNQWSISRRQLDMFLEKMKKASLMFSK
ncbi:LytTR family DNA-binding domain-containing protein [Mucilaginibacter sp.]|uniref:LytR/AlgR family response regulator transcription factor n=1 Tax=Mucilaginibacter sp. TaxID=1882438 RepID=UPI00284CF34F|nr:LytTR family DNA-binding domain-containing protein [Mucilaginibacter sp.]MDR3697051.1 LytTR family DNA-binding domain-containing protein [Mucilaginibacter sp.]